MRLWPGLWVLLATGTAAHAGDKPLIVPTPTWVVPVAPSGTAKPAGEAPITVLLLDQQVRFERGSVTTFSRSAVRIDTAQGLAAGNISLPWRPDVGDLQIHQLAIRRGTEVIDVLASGQSFTVVRREANLEQAMLDGVLTANIQPEGLQVGDVIEMAMSITERDPVVAGHVEQGFFVGGALPVARTHLRASWPAALPVRYRLGADLPQLKPARQGPDKVVTLSMDDLGPFEPVKFAPARFQLGRVVELSDFGTWAELGALMHPLYAKAAVLPASGPLADEVAKIRAASADPATRTMAALALVQDRVRYVALAMGAGGLVPADAATTWSRRYGDCKAKTALLLAILQALDIPAEAVVVNVNAGDGLDERLPAVGAFNHVLVRATVAGKPYWLDGTRTGDTALDRLAVPHFGWGLPIVPRGGALVRMVPAPLAHPTIDTSIAIDATAGLTVPAPVEVTRTVRGDDAIATNAALSNVAGDARLRALREMWRREYDFIDVDAATAEFDRATGELKLVMKGKARMDWSTGWYEADGLQLGYKADFRREPGRGHDAPFAVAYPAFTRSSETIKLPPSYPSSLPLDKLAIDRTVGGVEYRRSGALKDRVFRAEASERAIAPEFPASEAPAVQAALRAMASDTVYLGRPSNYAMTDAELTAALATTPEKADGFNARGFALLDRGRFDEAIAQFDLTLAREPTNVTALANRGLAHAWKQDLAAAERDLAAAERINPNDVVIHRSRGLIALRNGKWDEAVASFGKSLVIEPKDSWSLMKRAEAYRALNRPEAALADAATMLTIWPGDIGTHLFRTNVLRNQGKTKEALAEVDAAVAANPDNTTAYVAAANSYAAMGSRDEAMALFDRALAVKKEAFIYHNRYRARASDDLTGRRADLDAALAVDPRFTIAMVDKAKLLGRAGDHAAAVELLGKAVSDAPKDPALLAERAVAHHLAGNAAASARDFAAARTAADGNATLLNNLCWTKATAGIALDGALADCAEALRLAPGAAAYLDSKGLVLLRLGRLAEADATYTAALAVAPTQAASLWGRGIARSKAGEKAKGDADLAAARNVRPDVATEFADYGVVP